MLIKELFLQQKTTKDMYRSFEVLRSGGLVHRNLIPEVRGAAGPVSTLKSLCRADSHRGDPCLLYTSDAADDTCVV